MRLLTLPRHAKPASLRVALVLADEREPDYVRMLGGADRTDRQAQFRDGEAPARVVAISPAIRDAAPDRAPEYRHLRAVGIMRVAGGIVAAAAGIACLSYDAFGWAASFLVIAALNLAGGCWELTIARSQLSRT